MTNPYTDSEVNAAIAATIAEYQQKLDAANARVAELETVANWAARECAIANEQYTQTKGTMKAMCSGYAKAMLKVTERMRKVLDQ